MTWWWPPMCSFISAIWRWWWRVPARFCGRAAGWRSQSSHCRRRVRLQPTGRYAHAPAYLEALARCHFFECVAQQAVTLRVEQGRPVTGQLQLWRRTAE